MRKIDGFQTLANTKPIGQLIDLAA